MNKSLKTVLFVDLLILFFVFAQYSIFLYSDDFFFKFLQIQIFVFTIWAIYTCFKVSKSWFSLEILFIGTVILFLLSRVFLNLFFPEIYPAYGEDKWQKEFNYSDYTLLKINFVLLFTIVFLHIGIVVGYLLFKIKGDEQIKFSKFFNLKIAYILFAIGAIAYVYKVLYYSYVLKNYGYFAIYSGNFNLPLLVRVLDDFFYIGFFMIMVNKPSKKVAYSLSLFFILMYSTYILTGMRAEFLLIVLTVVWLLAFLYKINVSIKTLLLLLFAIVFMSQLNIFYKYNMSLDSVDITFLTRFFNDQGVTLCVLGYIIEFEDFFIDSVSDGFRHIISPFVNFFLLLTGQLGGKTEYRVDTVYSIGDRLTYYLNPETYLAGGGTGSTFVAELYTLGGSIFLLGIFTILLGIAIIYLTRRVVYKQYGLFLVVTIVPAIFWMSRGAYIYGFQKYIFAWVLIVSVVFMYEMIKKKKGLKV